MHQIFQYCTQTLKLQAIAIVIQKDPSRFPQPLIETHSSALTWKTPRAGSDK